MSASQCLTTLPSPTQVLGLIDQTHPHTSPGWLARLAGFLPSLIVKVFSFATMSIPLFFYRILTWSFTLHLNFTSLLVILFFMTLAAYWVVRYRFLTTYSRLKPIEPPKVTSSFDLHPDTPEDTHDSKTNFKNYPDEFLSAFLSSIKLFGYLEKPVFHELARHLQTKKMLAGDTLFRNPDQERSFYIVVDGHVQMFLKPENEEEESDDEGWAGLNPDSTNDRFDSYTLINEVGAGGTLSSLFTILSIFRESFSISEHKDKQKQRMQQQQQQQQEAAAAIAAEMGRDSARDGWRQVFPNIETQVDAGHLSIDSDTFVLRRPSASSSTSTSRRRRSRTGGLGSPLSGGLNSQDLFLAPGGSQSGRSVHTTKDYFGAPSPRAYRSVHPNIIARATVDTTLAVIPEEAFHKLTQKFPKAAAHIVQVIVTRFQRVTLMTSHRYLGLTKELMQLEKQINESVSIPALPEDFFTDGCMDRLRQKFGHEDEGEEDEETNDTTTARPQMPNGPAELSRTDSTRHIEAIDIIDRPLTPRVPNPRHNSPLSSSPRPGSNHSPSPDIKRQRNTGAEEEYTVEDDAHLRLSIMHCLADSLGIKATGNSAEDVPRNTLSPLASRRNMITPDMGRQRLGSTGSGNTNSNPYYPMDLFSHAGTVDSSASPSLDPHMIPYDDDIDALSTVSSVHSGSDIWNSAENSKRAEELSPEDIQILYFPKDAVLVKEGEHLHGIYFVIDGLLGASMTHAQGGSILSSNRTNNLGNNGSKRDSGNHDSRTNIQSPRKPNVRAQPSVKLNKNSKSELKTSSSSTSLSSAASSSGASPGGSNGPEVQGKSATGPFSSGTIGLNKDKITASDHPAGRPPVGEENENNAQNVKCSLFVIKAGGMVGYLDALTGYPSFMEVRANTDTYVGFLSKKRLDRIVDKQPSVMLKLAKQLVGLLSPLVLHIDLSLEWMQVHAGQVIYQEGQPSESIYMVLHGRLRTIREQNEGDLEILGEFGHGDTVGELEVMTDTPTPSTLHAIRDSELTRMPKTLFNALALRHPEITLQISRMVALRSLQLAMQRNTPGRIQAQRRFNLSSSGNGANNSSGVNGLSAAAVSSLSSSFSSGGNHAPELYGRNNVNLKTIGILPVNGSVPVTEFAESLKNALMESVGATCVLLNAATLTTVMGRHAFSRMGKLKMASWLAEQEERVRIVLYLADSGVTSQWTRTCIRQADCILLVGLGDGDPSVGEYERFLINMKTTARKELVLLHRERSCPSGTTQNWLKNRLWIQAHHHIFMPMRQHHGTYPDDRFRPPWLAEQGRKMTAGSISMLNNVKGQLEKYYLAVPTFGRLLVVKKKGGEGLNSLSSSVRNDFARLARRICGKSVALVLGGGGARGISHIGLIHALEEAGIPIDIVGGTSIGSFVGGLYAKNMDLVSTIARTKMFAGRVSSIWRQIMDLTYPVTAWFTGHEFNRAIWKCLGDSQIEDFWLPYFAVTTNITFSRMEVHTTGYAWRYIRASMSLSGYMPPICDNGNMLVDGGYMDNLPVSVAKNMGADIIIAVDVASEDDTSPVHYGDSISGWWALVHSFNPFRTYNIPSIADIQSRLAYVSSVSKLEEAKMIDGTLYVKLPVQRWGTLEFNKFTDVMQTGYDVGREVVGRWRKAGYATGRLTHTDGESILRGKEVKGKRGRRNSI
ncbi:hypothetical protein CLU79DRAFT_205783 [Phycomyces nitens]|nr:hypothetical protein CLU79DRAFT_205783 [Phycomyces nitens]